MTYRDALDFLFPRTTQIKFGLDTTRELLAAAGDPQVHFPSIHVAGTNGKGSVSTLMAAALMRHGLRVGLYTSPHLISFRERIRVDGVAISEDAVTEWTRFLRPAIEASGATFFEATTAIALAHFAARAVDIAVVEVGLGGRLDSTNVITPLVGVVTHIALDHQKYLGDTIDAIAREKAGIAKPGVPFVIGEADPALAAFLADAAVDAVRRSGAAQPPIVVPVPAAASWASDLGLAGPHQRRNAAVAEATLAVLPDVFRPSENELRDAFASARVAGRFDRRGRWLFDVAHNPDSMEALERTLVERPQPGPVHALVSILGDKEWAPMLVTLDRVVDVGVLTVAPSADTRRWDLAWLEQWLADTSRPKAQARWHLESDFGRALVKVQRGAGTVLATGSFHTVGDVMQALGMSAER